MTIISILLLIVLGIGLIVAEILLVPGSTIIGIIGLALSIVGVTFGFIYLESGIAWLLFTGTLAGTGVFAWLGFRTKTWQKFEVKNVMSSHSPTLSGNVQVGDTGVLITRCAPTGQARFGDAVEEVSSEGAFLESGSKIKVIHITNSRIIVESLLNQ
jgi:membrane-bound ClpP family serine protease